MRNSEKHSVHSPALPDTFAAGELISAVESAEEYFSDIEGMLFEDCEATGLSGTTLEFSGCRFDRCKFADWDFKRISFVDCLFDHCDISGLRLQNVTFQRVAFFACRMTGTEMLEAALMNVALNDCAADYFTLSGSKCSHVHFHACRFHESIWQDIAFSDVCFEQCDLTAAEIRAVSLAGQDMTTCVLDSIRIDPHDLRGMKVNPIQGLMFCRLLGLVIEE